MTPIVLQHGFMGVGDVGVGPVRISYFHRIDRAIAARGHPLIVPRVHPTGSIAKRASQLKRAILDGLTVIGRPREKVVIIAHSMGGLDSRYMLARLGMADRVRALVTVATPHRGSPFADFCLTHTKRLGAIALLKAMGLDVQASVDLTVPTATRFDQSTPDAPGVAYYSVSTARPFHRITPLLMPSHKIIFDAEGENDGLVSVASATRGTHLGTWPCDHLHSINKRWVLEIADRTGDITPYYLGVLDRLAADGLLEGSETICGGSVSGSGVAARRARHSAL